MAGLGVSAPLKYLSNKTDILTGTVEVTGSGTGTLTLTVTSGKVLLAKTLSLIWGNSGCTITSIVIDGVDHKLPVANSVTSLDFEDLYGLPLYIHTNVVITFANSSTTANCTATFRGLEVDSNV